MTSGKTRMTRREFARALGAAGIACTMPRAFAAGPSGPIRFQNTAPGNGLDFVLRNDANGRKYQVETVLGGLGVIDFDRVLRDPDDPAQLLAQYDSGDHGHPTDQGYEAMADSIDLKLFGNGSGY